MTEQARDCGHPPNTPWTACGSEAGRELQVHLWLICDKPVMERMSQQPWKPQCSTCWKNSCQNKSCRIPCQSTKSWLVLFQVNKFACCTRTLMACQKRDLILKGERERRKAKPLPSHLTVKQGRRGAGTSFSPLTQGS